MGKPLQRETEQEPFLGSRLAGEGGGETPEDPAPTLHVVVGFAAGHPLASLETPVVGVRQYHLHEDIVMGRGVEAGDIKAQERKHPPGEEEEKHTACETGRGKGHGVPRPSRHR